jgi:hypothetical protein
VSQGQPTPDFRFEFVETLMPASTRIVSDSATFWPDWERMVVSFDRK